MAKHTQTALDPLRQGIEIQGVVEDDFGNLVPGPHELWGMVGEVLVVIASVDLSGSFSEHRPNEPHPSYEISEEEALANLNRLAHCWNCHDDLVAALEKIAEMYPSDMESSRVAREALAKAKA